MRPVTQVLRGRRRKLNANFAQFLEYHLIEACFCNVARGNEKGHVEQGVGWVRRNLLTPMPGELKFALAALRSAAGTDLTRA